MSSLVAALRTKAEALLAAAAAAAAATSTAASVVPSALEGEGMGAVPEAAPPIGGFVEEGIGAPAGVEVKVEAATAGASASAPSSILPINSALVHAPAPATPAVVTITPAMYNKDLKPGMQRLAFALLRRPGGMSRDVLEVVVSEAAGGLARQQIACGLSTGAEAGGPAALLPPSGLPEDGLEMALEAVPAEGTARAAADTQPTLPVEPPALTLLQQLQVVVPAGKDAWEVLSKLAGNGLVQIGGIKAKLKEAFLASAAAAAAAAPAPPPAVSSDGPPPPPPQPQQEVAITTADEAAIPSTAAAEAAAATGGQQLATGPPAAVLTAFDRLLTLHRKVGRVHLVQGLGFDLVRNSRNSCLPPGGIPFYIVVFPPPLCYYTGVWVGGGFGAPAGGPIMGAGETCHTNNI